jgi:hypothetical protein
MLNVLAPACVLSIAIVIGAALIAGRFSVIPITGGSQIGYALIVDRFTGAAKFCADTFCLALDDKPRR